MQRTVFRILAVLAVAGAALAATDRPAAAHSHSHFFFGLNLSAPYAWGPPYYAPAYYYPPPVVYAPPPPAYYYPPPQPAAPACRDFQGDATIDGRGTPFYGRACLQADGRWHIVSTY